MVRRTMGATAMASNKESFAHPSHERPDKGFSLLPPTSDQPALLEPQEAFKGLQEPLFDSVGSLPRSQHYNGVPRRKMAPDQFPYDDQDAESILPHPSSDDLDLFKRFRSHRLSPLTSTSTQVDSGSRLISYHNARLTLISRAGSRYASSSASPRAQQIAEEDDDRNLTLSPVLVGDLFDAGKDLSTSLGYLDLTDSRTPSPAPKATPGEVNHTALPTPTGSSLLSKSTDTSQPPREDLSSARAHLRVDHLPSTYSSDDLLHHFSSLTGVLDASIQGRTALGAWGLVDFRSLMAAQHAYARKNCTIPPGGRKAIELKVYSAEARSNDPLNAAAPVPSSRPPMPSMLSAAELKRRVYVGSLPYGIGEDELASIFWERAGVKARVLAVKHAWDGSHSFAFVQTPDSLSTIEAIKRLHGTPYDGPHLLLLEPANEFLHVWRFSLRLVGLPPSWDYRDVSDFLISTIRSFAGLHFHGGKRVRVEFRYETDLRLAADQLEGREVHERRIGARIEQPEVRERVEEERRERRELERERARWKSLLRGGRDGRYGQAFDHGDGLTSASTRTRARERYVYDRPLEYTTSPWNGANGRRRNERSMSPRRRWPTAVGEGRGMGVEAYNPFSPRLRYS